MGNYSKQWTRSNRGKLIFMVDTSGSMAATDQDGISLIERVMDGCNSGVFASMYRNMSAEGIKNKMDFTVITYGNGGAKVVSKKSLADYAVEGNNAPTKKIKTSQGDIKLPQFISGLTAGGGTPMKKGFDLSYKELEEYCLNNPDSAPPLIIHMSDGYPNDPAATTQAAQRCLGLSTSDGNVLIFNLHMSAAAANKVLFPVTKSELSDRAALFLYDISSEIPSSYLSVGLAEGLPLKEGSKLLTQNGSGEDIAKIINFGSTVADVGEAVLD